MRARDMSLYELKFDEESYDKMNNSRSRAWEMNMDNEYISYLVDSFFDFLRKFLSFWDNFLNISSCTPILIEACMKAASLSKQSSNPSS